MSHRWIAMLLISLAAGCADEEPGVPDAGAGASAVTIAKDVRADHCEVTSLTCAAATFTCRGMPPDGEVSDHWNRQHRIAADGTATYTIAQPWSGRYASVICPRVDHVPLDASVLGCVVDVDTIALPEGCRAQTWRATGLPATIPDNTAAGVTSLIGVNEPTLRRNAIVDVDIQHADRSDLTVTLIEPGSGRTTLHNRTGGDADDLRRRFLVPIQGAPNGAWRLQASDRQATETGSLRAWSIRRASSCQSWLPCSVGLAEYCDTTSNTSQSAPILDNQTVTQTVQVAERGVTGEVRLVIRLAHARGSDLEIDLRAPGGRTERVWDGTAGDAAIQVVAVSTGHLADVSRAGTWTLTVRDRVNGATGVLHSWKLTTQPLCR